jgi:hypothetical protein
MNMTEFSPRFMATTLPTVPHRDPVKACRAILEYFPEAPCAPRLSLSARMFMDGMPCLLIDAEKRQLRYDLSREEELQRFYERVLSDDVDYFAIDPRHAPGFYALLDLLKQAAPPQLRLIHIQMLGLLTWGLTMTDLSGRPAWYDRTMREVLVNTLIMKTKWQAKKFREVLPQVDFLVTLGEPTLGLMDSPFGSISAEEVIQVLNEFFRQVEGLPCVHCCSNMDWGQLIRSETRVINFDAYQLTDKIALYPREIDGFLEKGGMLAWGIVPVGRETLESESEDRLLERLEEGMELLAGRGIDKQKLLERSFVTPCCTTATLTPEQAERVFQYTKNISHRLRQKYFGETAGF